MPPNIKKGLNLSENDYAIIKETNPTQEQLYKLWCAVYHLPVKVAEHQRALLPKIWSAYLQSADWELVLKPDRRCQVQAFDSVMYSIQEIAKIIK